MAEPTEVHPVFSSVPDNQTAFALSEYFLQSENFVRSTRLQYADFPPEPSSVVAATIAYREISGPKESVRRMFTFLSDPAKLTSNVGPELVERYAGEVKLTKDFIVGLGSDAVAQFVDDAMFQPAVDLARKAELRTVGSFLLMQTKDRKRFYHAFVIPRLTYNELPLLYRQGVMEMIKKLDESEGNDKTEFPEFARAFIDDAKQNGELTRQQIGFNSASLHMTEPDKIANIVIANLGKKPEPSQNREQRRAQTKRRRAS